MDSTKAVQLAEEACNMLSDWHVYRCQRRSMSFQLRSSQHGNHVSSKLFQRYGRRPIAFAALQREVLEKDVVLVVDSEAAVRRLSEALLSKKTVP